MTCSLICSRLACALPGAAEDGGYPAFAQLDPIQIAQRPDDTLIAQALLSEIQQRRHVQPSGAAAIDLAAMRTENFVLSRLDDEQLNRWDFGDLPPNDSSGLIFVKLACRSGTR